MSNRLPDTSARRAPENLAILLREPFLDLTEQLHRRFAERGHPEVRFAHGPVFQFLDDDGTRVSVLAERAQITKQSMAELVAHLEHHGYVERLPDPGDRRAKLVRVTPRGREVFAIAHELTYELELRAAERLGERKLHQLRALLRELGGAMAPATPSRAPVSAAAQRSR